ncbi:RNA polymerase sigma factor SigM [Aquipuribacter sp. SD81]|uniref:RNA polymerase sigma factor SigM n=1 Tax=Aquipuribacter sp. SD81 TaxID=3127703 RepID=UPI0030173078
MTAGGSDAALLDAHLAGDPDAFAELVRRHRDVLWAVAVRTTGNPADAEDALQEALVSALRSVERFERRSAVRTWLYRIVVNASLDRLRRAAARPTTPLDERVDPPSGVDEPARTAERLDVDAALRTLSPGQRAAVVLVHMHGLSVAQAAEVLELPEGTVKSRCSRGRAQLARVLRPGGDEERAGPGDDHAGSDAHHAGTGEGNPRADHDVQPGTPPTGGARPHATGTAGENR